jgi:imidazoleglycerol-phosphate dehydratase
MSARKATVQRQTKETDIRVTLNLDGSGRSSVDTGLPFLNHMLELLARHSLVDLVVKAKGDLEVDSHHTTEDIGLCLGAALDKALGTRRGIVRYGWALVPMDDALSLAAVDLGGRAYLVYETAHRKKRIGEFDLSLLREFLRALSSRARMNLHLGQLYGDDVHHAYESVFKALAVALKMACAVDKRVKGLPSSKGRI